MARPKLLGDLTQQAAPLLLTLLAWPLASRPPFPTPSTPAESLTYSSAEPKRLAYFAGEFYTNGLELGVLVERLQTVLPSDAALLIAAKGRGKGDGPVGVDPDRAGLEGMGDPVGPLHVLSRRPAPDRRA